MAEFKMVLGGAIDIVTPSELDEKLTGLQGHIDQKFQNKQQPIRRVVTGSLSTAFTTGVSQVLEFAISKPPMGRVWVLRRLTITGGDDRTTVANMAGALYQGDPATPMLGNLVIPSIAVPYFDTFNSSSVVVDDSENLFLSFTSSANIASQTLVAIAAVDEHYGSAYEQQYA